ncbi:BMQ_0737 family morphogenetic spore coat protein [Brevibacillus choshinensis]|uniref:HYR domain-containing protein n=1 Tax=Brevibacillus choshinensis TaxID=54911 RepID=UPI0006EBF5A1|nr:HYR domain-containing protein [Brevibacillus choshinensis]
MPTQNFTFTGGIQSFIVPPTVTSLTIRAVGARGGDGLSTGGRGAYIQGDFPVTPGDVLSILVGGAGGGDDLTAGGGGGGSFVWRTTSPVDAANILIAAGGGGGGAQGSQGGNANEESTSGQAGAETLGGAGGMNGLGGNGGAGFVGGGGAGGAGIIGNGVNGSTGAIGGKAISTGGAGGGVTGGFGGGGEGSSGGGGGGGYSGGGGGGGTNLLEAVGGGGGGGSFNSGTNQKNVSGVGTGNGAVVITFAAVTLNFTGGLQTFVVPPCVTSLTIQAVGARGGFTGGFLDVGRGAFIQGDFPVTPGEELTVLVGGKGVNHSGGGGTFVWRTTNLVTAANLLVAAGGGGGEGTSLLPGKDAVLTTGGTAGSPGGTGGINGLGGIAGAPDDGGGGGGGIVGNGFSSPGGGGGGFAINAGGAGGAPDGSGGTGGFGGGGGGGASGGGGGGGFSGGGGGNGLDPAFPIIAGSGGGGGSFNGGTNQLNLTRIGLDNGVVIFSFPFVEPPIITCPPNMFTGTDPGEDFATVTYTVTAASPGCGIVSISCSPSGVVHNFPSVPIAEADETMMFPRGTTEVTCTATDAAGNTSSCTFTVTVFEVFPTETPPAPINLEASCIRVQKVYDWIVSSNRERSKVPVPEECLPMVDAAIQSGMDIAVRCIEPAVPPVFPLSKSPRLESVPDFSCGIVSVRRAQMTINQTSFLVGIVRFVSRATVLVSIFADGDLLCEFPVTVQFYDEVLLCLPQPLDENNIFCRITGIECSVNTHFLFGGMVELDIVVCKEIQVEAEIKMEVLGEFCSPRPNNIPLPSPTPAFRCPPSVFPPQCPFFPLDE